MKDRIINIGASRYLSESMEDLPNNCILNKVLTGVGASTVALANDVPYVIAVPYINLIKSKKKWAKENGKDILGVYGSVSIEQIKAYKGNKIMTTWDGLGKVLEAIDPSKWKILIDEYHTLLEAAAFRKQAIFNVLTNYKKFKSFIFMSATPIDDKYQIEELKNIDKVTLKFDEIQKINVSWNAFETDLTSSVSLLIYKHLTGEILENAHIFINSVSLICQIIEELKEKGIPILQNVKIVCADNTVNAEKVAAISDGELEIEPITSPVVRINFYTATAFEGCDIYDENSISYIVTDGKLDHTKINLFTTLPQIIGRVRDSIHKNKIIILYAPNKFSSSISEEEFETVVKEDIDSAKEIVNEYNIVKSMKLEMAVKAFGLGYKDCAFIYAGDDGEFIVNDLYWNSQMHMYSTINKVYHVKNIGDTSKIIKKRTNNALYNITQSEYTKYLQISSINKLELKKKPKYQDLLQSYIGLVKELKNENLKDTQRDIVKNKIALIEQHYGDFKKALAMLGETKLHALRYQRSLIRQEMIKLDGKKGKELKVVELLNFKNGDFITLADLKTKLKSIYTELDLEGIVTAKEIENYYKIKPVVKRLNGKHTKGYEILYPLFQY
jgi:hypothetical protein